MPPRSSRFNDSRFAFALLVALSIPLLFAWCGSYAFVDPDEGRYASIPWEMRALGDWITPSQNRLQFFDKPPLLYWLIGASYGAFGTTELAARIVPALAALGGIIATYGLGRRMFGARAGFFGACILSTSLLWPIMGRLVMTDMLVSSLVFCALAFWWLGHSESETQSLVVDQRNRASAFVDETNQARINESSARLVVENQTKARIDQSSASAFVDESERGAKARQSFYFGAFWLALALGVLAKGPISVVLCAGAIGFYLLVTKQRRALGAMRWSWGVALFALVAVPWFVLVARANSAFNHYFWFDQHIGRFLGNTSGNDHRQSPLYYFVLLPVIFFPWSVWMPTALISGIKARFWNGKHARETTFLLGAAGFIVLFFTASSGKLVTYILPAMPPIAILLGAYFDALRVPNRALKVSAWVLALLLAGGGFAILVFGRVIPQALEISGAPVVALGLLLMAWAIALIPFSRRGAGEIVAATTLGFTLTVAAFLPVLVQVAPHYTTPEVLQTIRAGLAAPGAQLYTYRYIQSVPFYARMRFGVLEPQDEVGFGIAQLSPEERERWILSGDDQFAAFGRRLNTPTPVYLLIRNAPNKREELQKVTRPIGNGLIFIARNGRYVVFGNAAAARLTPPVSS